LIGYLQKDKKSSHIYLIIGWVLFGIFWLTQMPYFLSIGDTFNAVFCLLGFILFVYFAYHESLNYKWNEYLFPLNYIAGIAATGGLFYYLFERIEPLSKALIYTVAAQSTWLFNLFGYDAKLLDFSFDHEFFLPIEGTEYNGIRISIILACTGIQSIAIFVGILLVTKSNRTIWEPWSKKQLNEAMPNKVASSKISTWLWNWRNKRLKKVIDMTDRSRYIRSFIYTVPVIYILNLFRNALIMYGHVNATLGPSTYDITHNYLSKILSLVVLIIMVFLIFELLPECREGIIGLIDLKYRIKPGLVKDGFVDLDKVDEMEERLEKKQAEKKRKSLEKPENKSSNSKPK
jgi:exosortase/archaeosortase family protein